MKSILSIMAVLLLSTTALMAQDEEAQAEEKAEQAPKRFKVIFELSNDGEVELEVARKLAPIGVDQFYKLVKSGFYDECRFFRVVPGFFGQFGINGDPEVQKNGKKPPFKTTLFCSRISQGRSVLPRPALTPEPLSYSSIWMTTTISMRWDLLHLAE